MKRTLKCTASPGVKCSGRTSRGCPNRCGRKYLQAHHKRFRVHLSSASPLGDVCLARCHRGGGTLSRCGAQKCLDAAGWFVFIPVPILHFQRWRPLALVFNKYPCKTQHSQQVDPHTPPGRDAEGGPRDRGAGGAAAGAGAGPGAGVGSLSPRVYLRSSPLGSARLDPAGAGKGSAGAGAAGGAAGGGGMFPRPGGGKAGRQPAAWPRLPAPSPAHRPAGRRRAGRTAPAGAGAGAGVGAGTAAAAWNRAAAAGPSAASVPTGSRVRLFASPRSRPGPTEGRRGPPRPP